MRPQTDQSVDGVKGERLAGMAEKWWAKRSLSRESERQENGTPEAVFNGATQSQALAVQLPSVQVSPCPIFLSLIFLSPVLPSVPSYFFAPDFSAVSGALSRFAFPFICSIPCAVEADIRLRPATPVPKRQNPESDSFAGTIRHESIELSRCGLTRNGWAMHFAEFSRGAAAACFECFVEPA
ncbi:hypothetical protein Enr13x_26710 [Stieleria neptunia]|uniref:Uncharacterized protein n=1 Tax=Stieleria neptunia TaxID=2527979 RepID=A0A518HPR0_9BACT|nr:hypothetical protein Enr13x_26710 [Stieleria neptunia]